MVLEGERARQSGAGRWDWVVLAISAALSVPPGTLLGTTSYGDFPFEYPLYHLYPAERVVLRVRIKSVWATPSTPS